MVVRTPRRRRLEKLRRGVMELYISDHPLDCLTCPPTATASCRTWPASSACARCATATTANHLDSFTDDSNPYFTFDDLQVHRLQPLRARLRGGPGHLRADHRRPRLRLASRPGGTTFMGSDACRAAPACRPARPPTLRRIRHRDRHADPLGGDHLRLLRRRLLVPRRDARRPGGAHGPRKDGRRQPTGHSCVKGRFAWGYASTRTASPRRWSASHPTRGASVGWEAIAFAASSSGASRPGTAALASAASLLALHQRGNLPRPEDDPARSGQQQRRHLRRASATRRPATA